MRRRPLDVVVLAIFAAYTAVALLLLLLGLGAALAVDGQVHARFLEWAGQGGIAALFFRAMANAARFTEPLPVIVVDYVLSALQIGVGVFVIWRRPGDLVARLLAFALVGTGMGFNFQAHGVVAIAAGAPARGGVRELVFLNLAHYAFHAVSGAAYVHALLTFPNGRVVPHRLWVLPPILYGLAAEEVFIPLWNRLTSPPDAVGTPGLINAIFTALFNVTPLQTFENIISSEVSFFVLLFGFLIPIIGLAAQTYRYRVTATAVERAQTRVVVWALTVAFSLGIIVMALAAVAVKLQGQVFTTESSFTLQGILLRLSAPLFTVLPVAVVVAILRYRLFDVVVVLDRTLVYAPLTAALALVFLGSLWLLQQILHELLGGPSELAIALAAFVNAMLFQPLRRRLQRFIDRRFFGTAAAAKRTAPAS